MAECDAAHNASPEFLTRMHIAHCIRCLRGLPSAAVEVDCARMMVAYYCLSSLDLLSGFEPKVSKDERNDWTAWIWAQYISNDRLAGFRGAPVVVGPSASSNEPPHILMTYTALLSLAILRDDFSRLDRRRVLNFLAEVQLDDGSFEPWLGSQEGGDVRIIYAALAICHMINDWSSINLEKTLAYISACRTYEGGYGQTPFAEANGGATYCAIASLQLASQPLQGTDREHTLRWLLQRQRGGFQGRTEKEQDACYSFWCGAAIALLGGAHMVDCDANAQFLLNCQFRLGGIAKAVGEFPDPLHTYLGMAAMAIYPPSWGIALSGLDPLLNVRPETGEWIKGNLTRRDHATRE